MNTDGAISVVVAGDFCPTERVERAVDQLADPAALLGPAVDLFRRADLAIANLEFPVTLAETRLAKFGPNLKGHPKTLAVLKQAGVGLVDLANNHTLDYGAQGLADTLQACAAQNMGTVGAGPTLEEAQKPYCVTIKGRRVAVLGICENEFSTARHGRGGAYGLDPIENYYSIRRAREDADIVIVLLHGGNEFTHYPSPRMLHTCRFLADAGASAVVCHHPHYLQGAETYRGVPILYSLGKLFHTNSDYCDMLEVPVARLEFAPESLECAVHFEFFRLSLEQMRLTEMPPDALQAVRERFRTYCAALDSPETISAEWGKFCAEKHNFYLFLLLSLPVLFLRIARRLGVDRWVRTYARWKRKELLCLENLMRCEAHREAVLYLLEREHMA